MYLNLQSTRHDHIAENGASKGVIAVPKVSQLQIQPSHYGDMRIMNRDVETSLKEQKRKREATEVIAVQARKKTREEVREDVTHADVC